jgi:phage terminase small subunit
MAAKSKPSAKRGAKAAVKKAAKAKAAPKAAKKVKRVSTLPVKTQPEVFVREYLVDLNQTQAAIRAGYSPASARQTASRLMATPAVAEAITKAMVERAQATAITADKVLERYWAIATANPQELTSLYRACCRYCWGKDHHYQWTPQELRDALRARQKELAFADEKQLKLIETVDETGGTDFDARKDPNPGCPECHGAGVERVHFKDTRDLSPAARLLFAGVKTTQNGMEVKVHDQMAALQQVGRHLGMFKDKVEHTGKDGAELAFGVVVVPAKRAPAGSAPEPDTDDEEPQVPLADPLPEDKLAPLKKKFQVRAPK